MKWLFSNRSHPTKGTTTFTATTTLEYSKGLAEFLDRKTLDKIVDKAVELWIEEHGDKLLAKITPEEVEKAVKQNLAKRVLGD